MPARKNKTSTKINLIPTGQFEASTFGRVLKWLLSSFRIIVIAVELIVLVVFISRFWLDAKNSDLNDTIKQKEAQIRASASFENEFRSVQQKIDVYKLLTQDQNEAEIINAVISSMPQEIRLESVSITEEGIIVTGTALNEQPIASYIANLSTQDSLLSAELSSLRNNPIDEIFLEFALRIKPKLT